MVAWIEAADGRMTLGGVVDILAGELAAALAIDEPNARATRDHAARTMIRAGTGHNAIQPYVEIWRDLQPTFGDVAIVASVAFDVSDTKVVDLLNGGIRSEQELVT